MGASISVISYNISNGSALFNIVLTGESYAGDTYYIDVKNTDSSHYSNVGERALSNGASESISIELGYTGLGKLFTGTSKTFRVRWNGDSGTTTITFPLKQTPYTDSYTIAERPMQQTQYVTYDGATMGQAGSCVANTTASCVEVLKMRTGDIVYPYSVGWIYGGAGNGINEDGLYFEPTFDFLKTNGVPPAQVLNSTYTTGYPDIYFQPDAKALYNNNYSSALKYATPQRIGSWVKLTGDYDWNFSSIYNAIQTENTTVLITLNINKALDDASSNGWVGALKDSIRGGHSMIVIGWVLNGGKYYWVCQNSWGSASGDNGVYYIPFDHFSYDSYGIWDFYALTRDANAPIMPAIPENTGIPVLSSRTPSGFNIMCNPIANATYEFRYRREDTTYYSTKASNTNMVLIDSLDYGYTYFISVRFLRNGIYSPYSQESQCTVLPNCPIIDVVYSTTSNNIIVKLKENSMTGKYSYLQILRRKAPWENNNTLDTKNVPNLQTSSEWTGLQKGERYSFSVVGMLQVNGVTLQSYYRSIVVEGIVGTIRPPFFSWDTEKVAGQPINVTASEWNKLTQNINAMLSYRKLQTRTFTTAYPNQKITASIFNEVRTAIYTSGTGLNSSIAIPSAVTWSGNPVIITANHFNKIVESLNSVM